MDSIKPCNTYSARPAGTALYRNGPHAFKLYYVDIIGRAEPERYEWDRSGLRREDLELALTETGVEGIGAVVSFPHITKVFRFAPAAETIMHVRAFNTRDFAEIPLARGEGYLEFACYAEAIIAAEEYRFWAEADCVETYLRQWAQWSEAVVLDNKKMLRYYESNAVIHQPAPKGRP